jgi:hypothetical protein
VTGRAILLAAGAAHLLAACTEHNAAVEIRARPGSVSEVAKAVPLRIAEARGHLLLGNVALAIESYRKALRDDPQSPEALRGLAQCYERMGRHDLARRYYEQALAVAPDSPDLLSAFAASLELQGERTQADTVRSEILARRAPAALAPALRPITSALLAELLNASPQLAGGPAPEVATGGPRLERLSPGEVALVTREEPRWEAQTVHRTAQSTTLRFVPLPAAAGGPSVVRLLNAARQPGLAATARALLAERGWSGILVGDAAKVRQASLILYPAAGRATAERLAAQFGFPMQRRAAGDEILLLLGRDAVAALRSGTPG